MKMKYFILKLMFFAVPILMADLALVLNGILYSEKNDYFIRSTISHAASTGERQIIFFGTSRTNTGVSGEAVRRGLGNSFAGGEVINLGLDGKSATASLALASAAAGFPSPEVAVVEVLPGINPMNNLDEKGRFFPFSSMAEGFLGFWFNKVFVLHNGIRVLKVFLGSQATKYMNCHADGWTEIHCCDCPAGISNARATWVSYARKNTGYSTGEQDFGKFARFIRGLKFLEGSKIVFLIMPVDGPVLECQEEVLRRFDPYVTLSREFPGALFLNANHITVLKSEPTYEYSHLAGEEAGRFSERLGKILSDSLPVSPSVTSTDPAR